ncbi:phage tail protein [Rhodococcus sp. SC4]|nr:phage tail protein [Rhodococcus sp. SC4]
MTAPLVEDNPLLHDKELMDRMQAIYDDAEQKKKHRARRRRKPPLTRLWDGDMNYRGRVSVEWEAQFRWVMNNTGTGRIVLPHDHYLAKWAVDPYGRPKQNVHCTVDKDGARWGGRLQKAKLSKVEDGKRFIELQFLDDLEETKHLLVWCNPFTPAIVQFPRSFVLAGPSRYMLKLALFLNIMRMEGNWWALPDDPLDPAQWGQALNMSNWNMVVKPHAFGSDTSPWTVLSSRFKYWFDMAAPTLGDAQLMVTTRRYLRGDPPPWPGANLRHGTIVFDVVDKSGYWDETSTGGTIFDGLKRTIVTLAGNLVDEILTTATEPIDPYKNIVGTWLGTYPRQPYVVYRDGRITGVEAADWEFTCGTSVQMVTGGHSMYGINEGISAGVQLVGNNLGQLIFQPTAGTIADTFLRPIYSDTIAAWMSIKSPVRALKYGWSHYQEDLVPGADRAYTLSSIMKIREGFHRSRPRTAHRLKLGDGRPYFIGDNGQGHFFLGDRIGSTIIGAPQRGRVYVEQVGEIELAWDRGKHGWQAVVGDPQDLESPIEKTARQAANALGALRELGVV